MTDEQRGLRFIMRIALLGLGLAVIEATMRGAPQWAAAAGVVCWWLAAIVHERIWASFMSDG